jgi:Ca-activated chloride channel family protein
VAPVAQGGPGRPGQPDRPNVNFFAPAAPPPALAPVPGAAPVPVAEFARKTQEAAPPGDLPARRGDFADKELKKGEGKEAGGAKGRTALDDARDLKADFDQARERLAAHDLSGLQTGKLGVDLSVRMQALRNQTQLERTAVRQVQGRSVLEIGGVWIDTGFDAKMPTVTVKAQSDAYFRILERQPQVKDVFRMGNHLVWVTPSGTALVIDTSDGKDKLSDEEIDKLFVARK